MSSRTRAAAGGDFSSFRRRILNWRIQRSRLGRFAPERGSGIRSPEPRCRFLIRSRFIRRNGGKIANGDRKNEELGPIVSRLIGRREISRRNGRSGYFAVRPSGGAVNFHFRSSWDQYLLDRKLWLVSTYVSYYVSVPVPSIDVTIGFICSRNN